MTKKFSYLIIVLAVTFVTQTASAERVTVRKNVLGHTIINDSSGRTVIRTDILGNQSIRHPDGSRTKVRTDVLGNIHIRGSNGQRTTIKTDILGNTRIRSNHDRRIQRSQGCRRCN